MAGRSATTSRQFAGGWLSDGNASIMALIWQISPRDGQPDAPGYFEAEVIQGVEKVASISGATVDEVRRQLDDRFGQAAHPNAASGE